MLSDSDIKKNICSICRLLWQRNMLAGADGNVSCRTLTGNFRITPSGRSKRNLDPDDIVEMDAKGNSLSKNLNPSGEKLMHLKIYQKCHKARSVIHAHPPHAIAWSLIRPKLRYLPTDSLSEVILACGKIPIAEFATPGSVEMGEALEELIPKHRVLILSHHGALSWGESLEEAYRGMERVEHVAKILYLAHQLGEVSTLPEEELKKLHKIREGMGETVF